MNKELRLLENQMSNFNDFQKMIKNLNDENLSELCEEFLTNHEAAMDILFKHCSDFGLIFLYFILIEKTNLMSNKLMHYQGD